jgi:hypothetical protein
MPRTIGRLRKFFFAVGLIALAVSARAGSDSPVSQTGWKLNPQEALELRKELDEHARLSKLPVLHDGDPDEVRLWVSGTALPPLRIFAPFTIGYETFGHVASGKGALICRVENSLTRRSPIVGRCRSDKHASISTPLAPLLEQLAKYSDQELDCGWVDGYWIVIEGISAGRRFALESSNPDACQDDGSKFVMRIITETFGKPPEAPLTGAW